MDFLWSGLWQVVTPFLHRVEENPERMKNASATRPPTTPTGQKRANSP
jgi:hypothetical protein